MIRAIGPRAVIEPIDVGPQSSLVQLTDHEPPTVGRVVSVGKHSCEECGCVQGQEFKEGDVVLIPHYGGQEVEVDGKTVWVVRLEHIIGHWQDEKATAQGNDPNSEVEPGR